MNRLDQLAPWVEQLGANSLKAIPLILLLFVAQKRARRWITPRGMLLLCSLVLIRLFMPEFATAVWLAGLVMMMATASALGTEFANYRDEVRIDQTFRGTAKDKIEVGFAIRNGKENAPGMDQDYIFYLNGDGDVLKIARYQ